MFLDARIPLTLTDTQAALPNDTAAVSAAPVPGAVAQRMLEAFDPRPHRLGCRCCAGRHPVATALEALFQDRVRGRVPFFRQAVVVAPDPAGLRATLEHDAILTARFRFTP